MDNKQNTITVEQMTEILSERFPQVETIDYYGLELEIYKTVPLDVFCEIAEKVAEVCFDANTGAYKPELTDFALRMCVIDAYTNVALPDDVALSYVLLYHTDLYDWVRPHINNAQFEVLAEAITDRIVARNDANKTAFDNGVQAVLNQIDEIGAQLTEMFGSVTADDMKKLVKAIGKNGEIGRAHV